MGIGGAEKQLAEWKSRGEWTERDAAICRLLSQWPLGTTSQIAWVLFHSASGLVLARRAMRRLQRMGVVERQRLALRVGRPEDVYRVIPEWAQALGLPVQAPLEGDLARHWMLADVLADSLWRKASVVVAPAGDSRADWVVRRDFFDEDFPEMNFLVGHEHEYVFLIDSQDDFDRMMAAARAFEHRMALHPRWGIRWYPPCKDLEKMEKKAQRDFVCASRFTGLDVSLSVETMGLKPAGHESQWENQLWETMPEHWADVHWAPRIWPYHPVRIPLTYWSA